MTTTGTSTTPTFEHSCTLERNGELYEHMMLNDTAESILLSVWGAEGCTLRVLVVGGGGSGTYMAGAGSGYIEYQTLAIPPGDTPVRALVGGPGHRQTCNPCLTIFCNNLDAFCDYCSKSSNIAYTSGHRSTISVGDTTVTAQRGQNGGHSGGAGYSGGGDDGEPGYDGGRSGGDGRGPGGGRGSGDNIRGFTLTSWSLAPGRGGQYYRTRGSGLHYSYFGGGGGGVLVDSTGPQVQLETKVHTKVRNHREGRY